MTPSWGATGFRRRSGGRRRPGYVQAIAGVLATDVQIPLAPVVSTTVPVTPEKSLRSTHVVPCTPVRARKPSAAMNSFRRARVRGGSARTLDPALRC